MHYSTDKTLNDFINGYVTAMLWSTSDESTPAGGEPLDANYGDCDFAPTTRERVIADCAAFYTANRADLVAGPTKQLHTCSDAGYAGHDFWLTRAGHGCGFWDGDWPAEAAKRLTAASQRAGELSPYVGGDGRIYF